MCRKAVNQSIYCQSRRPQLCWQVSHWQHYLAEVPSFFRHWTYMREVWYMFAPPRSSVRFWSTFIIYATIQVQKNQIFWSIRENGPALPPIHFHAWSSKRNPSKRKAKETWIDMIEKNCEERGVTVVEQQAMLKRRTWRTMLKTSAHANASPRR